MAFRVLIAALLLSGVVGCGPSYSPDTYASNAAQQANKVEQGLIVGVRTVGVSAAGTVGTLTGGAAGGIAGSQAVSGPASAFAALGGALVGGVAGSAVEHATADTRAFEYIVRKPNGDLISVAQKDTTPLVLGQKVLVITGNQARVVPDYTVPPLASVATAESAKPAPEPKPEPTSAPTVPAAVNSAPATASVAAPMAMGPPGSAAAGVPAPAVTAPTPSPTEGGTAPGAGNPLAPVTPDKATGGAMP